MKKIFYLVLVSLIGVLLVGCSKKSKDVEDVQKNTEMPKSSYLDLYRDYVYNDIFESKEIMGLETFNGIIVNIDLFSEPILIANFHHDIDGNFIKIYYIENGEVKSTKSHKANKVKYLYNIKDDKKELFIYEDNSYKVYSALEDIISKNDVDIRSVKEDNMNQEYVLTRDNIEYGIVDKKDYNNTFNKLDELYKKRDNISLDNEVKSIKNELVFLKDDEITYKDYHISYGKYAYDDIFITLNKDKTYRFDYNINGDFMHIDGVCNYGYKYIYCIISPLKFSLEVVGDNKLKYIDKTKKYNDEIFSYGG